MILSSVLTCLMLAEFIKTVAEGESSPVWYTTPILRAITYVSVSVQTSSNVEKEEIMCHITID